MHWQDQLNGDTLTWLLEKDDPGVRYLAMRDLQIFSPEEFEYQNAAETAHREGPIAAVLSQMEPEGFWVRSGAGYNPKYRSTVWALILLGQLGASVDYAPQIGTACRYLLDHSLSENGQFSTTRTGAPSGTIDCLQGNLIAALMRVGYSDPRMDLAVDWMSRSLTGEGVAPLEDKSAPLRFYRYKSGPDFICGVNGDQLCAWGGVKVMLAFSHLRDDQRTPLVNRAIDRGVELMLGIDPLTAAYPTRDDKPPSRNWWKFGFPVFYITDLLQNVEALVRLGYGGDPRLANALGYIRDKQDDEGRWALDYAYTDKTWVDFGEKKQPNKWVTLRVLRVLKGAAQSAG